MRERSPMPSWRRTSSLRLIAWAGLGCFAVAVVAEHAVEPTLSPVRHMVSEFANSPTGAVMTIGFAAWSASLLACALLAWDQRLRLLAALLAVAAAGLAVTALFHTQTVAGNLPPGVARSTAGHLHDHGSGIAELALLAAALTGIQAVWRETRARALLLTLILGSVTAVGILLIAGDPAPGLRQRGLIAASVVWQAALIAVLGRRLEASPG